MELQPGTSSLTYYKGLITMLFMIEMSNNWDYSLEKAERSSE